MKELPRNRILVGDARQRLASLPGGSVDCVVTSPPYFALRNYAMAGQLGLEATVTEWVDDLLAVMDELARLLKPAGTLWLNLGDSYSRREHQGAPPKGLLLAPERLLLALANRGWVVRNKIVWAKTNPLPMSAADRLTCAWEPLYLLTRSRHYHFDLDAIRQPHRSSRPPSRSKPPRSGPPAWAGPLAGNQSGLDRLHAQGAAGHPLGKNPGDVWTLPTAASRTGHHASFPEGLIHRPILAGTPERVCATCGLAWRRQRVTRSLGRLAVIGGLRPDCACGSDYRPGLVLDPFIGSGTVAVVAERLGRDWLGIELNPAFADMAMRRLQVARRMKRHQDSSDAAAA
ncbi:MAG TPA: site-specific DNA-methyltransferase [Acidimicrobiales bacterium]|nr:site-specific DNA-methyltransferase [Acidimicrobiales bacterium]